MIWAIVIIQNVKRFFHRRYKKLRNKYYRFRFGHNYRQHKWMLLRQYVFQRDGYKCVYCGFDKDLTIDHVIPRSAKGLTTKQNLVTACVHCNKTKGQSIPIDRTKSYTTVKLCDLIQYKQEQRSKND
jgi:5-methylcytosine-specific restriction endonuclease McrA